MRYSISTSFAPQEMSVFNAMHIYYYNILWYMHYGTSPQPLSDRLCKVTDNSRDAGGEGLS